MNVRRGLLIAILASWLLPMGLAQTQSSGSSPTPTPSDSGREAGGYVIHQSIEIGGRISETTGSVPMYDTLVNLQSGARVLDQTLSMESPGHTGILFDSLYFSSFGWGGDPSNAARLRMSKVKWYNFNATFRRDQNYFDYDLFANPLNPPTSTPNIPVGSSPHGYFNVRRMYDLNLVLLPQSRVSFRLGFNRVRNEGPSFSSLHEGTEALLFQPINNTTNQFRIGADVKLLPKTTLSYTQSLQYFKGDTDYGLAPFGTFPLANGAPAQLGLSWDTVGRAPCATPLIGVVANPACNGYLSYFRNQRARTTIPTEDVSLRSNSIRKLDVMGHVSYSGADMLNPVSDVFNGLVTRTNQRVIDTTAADHATWVSVVAELGVTYYVTDRFRIIDTFRFDNYRIPSFASFDTLSFFNALGVRSPGSLLGSPVTFPGSLPLHTASSSPDVVTEPFNWFLGEDSKTNRVQLEYDFSSKIGAHIGYQYRHRLPHNSFFDMATETFFPPLSTRGDCAGVQPNPNIPCTVVLPPDAEDNLYDITEHTGLAGVWVRPTSNLHFNFDVDFSSADGFVTRISPTHQQEYRGRASYTPRPWLNLAADIDVMERRNPAFDVNYLGHNRNYGFNAVIAPNDRFALDLAYNYTDYLQNTNICYVGTFNPPGTFTCVNDNTLLEILGNYSSTTHFGSFDVMFKPVHRVSAKLGYNITDVGGSTLTLNQRQPLGPLASRFQSPMASLAVELTKGLTWNTGWNYYQYNENAFVGPTLPRYFHANLTTLSLKYSF